MKNHNSSESPNSRLFSDNCLISLSWPLPDRRSNLGWWIFPQQCWKFVWTGAAGARIVLRRPFVLEAAQPSRTLSRFHPQRRPLPLSTFCWLVSLLSGRAVLAGCLSKCHIIECACRNVLSDALLGLRVPWIHLLDFGGFLHVLEQIRLSDSWIKSTDAALTYFNNIPYHFIISHCRLMQIKTVANP